MNSICYKIYRILYKLRHKDAMLLKIKMLRKSGMEIGENARLFNEPMTSEPYLISIGNNVTVASGVRFVTHDNSICKCENSQYTDLAGRIDIGDNCFIGVGAIIMYGVSLAERTIIGAGSVVTKSITEPGGVYVGNPARKITTVQEFYMKNEDKGFSFRINGSQVSSEQRKKIILSNTKKLIER